MNDTFEVQLERIRGKIHTVDLNNQFERRSKSLLYYSNHAGELYEAALLLGKSEQISRAPFRLLAGLSIEVILKGTLLGLTGDFPKTHNLIELTSKVGTMLAHDEEIILKAMTEDISWASKYPAPKDEKSWIIAQNIFDLQRRPGGKLGAMHIPERTVNVENYSELWRKFSDLFWRTYGVLH